MLHTYVTLLVSHTVRVLSTYMYVFEHMISSNYEHSFMSFDCAVYRGFQCNLRFMNDVEVQCLQMPKVGIFYHIQENFALHDLHK